MTQVEKSNVVGEENRKKNTTNASSLPDVHHQVGGPVGRSHLFDRKTFISWSSVTIVLIFLFSEVTISDGRSTERASAVLRCICPHILALNAAQDEENVIPVEFKGQRHISLHGNEFGAILFTDVHHKERDIFQRAERRHSSSTNHTTGQLTGGGASSPGHSYT